MWRAPLRCAPFTCTSARSAGSSTTIGSGSTASPSASARKPRSTAPTATANETLSRNASSGTTRMSVGEHALQAPLRLRERRLEVVQLLAESESYVVRQPEVVPRHEQHAVLGPHLLHQVEGADPLAILHQADRSGLRGVPAERVTEALEPLLDHRVVGPEDTARALEHFLAYPRLERHGGEVIARARRPDGGVVVPGPRFAGEPRWPHHPADPQARQAVRLREAVHDDHALVAAPERRGRGPLTLRTLVHLVREQPGTHLRRATHDGLSHLPREHVSRRIVRIGHDDQLRARCDGAQPEPHLEGDEPQVSSPVSVVSPRPPVT